jgi:hypothetical protein
MTQSLDEAYFLWLGSQLREKETTKEYWDLCHILHEKEFVHQVANDDNRMEDGKALRREFRADWRLDDSPASMLEVIIALSRRIAWDAGGDARGWAWQLIKNLKLERAYDPIGPRKRVWIDNTLEALIWRNYDADGNGGFFPLAFPERDQRKVEIWYQMGAWIDELHPG